MSMMNSQAIKVSPPKTFAFGKTASSIKKPQPQVLALSDLDKTALPWEVVHQKMNDVFLKKNQALFQQKQDQLGLFAITGNPLGFVKEFTNYLKGFPLLGVATNNGQEIYLNSQKLPAHQWLQSLSEKDHHPTWRRLLHQKYGWNRANIINMMNTVLVENGFEKMPDQQAGSSTDPYAHLWNTYRRPSETDSKEYIIARIGKDVTDLLFKSSRMGDQALEKEAYELGNRLSEKIRAKMKAQNIKHTHVLFQYPNTGEIHQYAHQDIHKANAAEFIAGLFKGLKAIIPLGDGGNDELMLSRKAFQNGTKSIPSFPVVTGNALDFNHLKQQNPQIEKTQHHGDLTDATLKQLEKALNSKPLRQSA